MMARFLGITSSIISLFILSWCMSRWLGPAHCINSTLVSKVVMEPGHDIIQMCDPVVKLTAPALPFDLVKSGILERLNTLESLKDYWGHLETKTEIIINRKAKQQILFQPGQVILSLDQLMIPGVAERALLYQHFSGESDFAAAVKSDFLWNEFVIRSPIDLPLWVSRLNGMNGYCHSESVLLSHKTYCAAHNQYSDSFITDVELGPTPWSLEPYFVAVLRKLYESQDIQKKTEFLKNLIFLSEPDSTTFDKWTRIEKLADVDALFLHEVKNFLMPMMVPESQIEAILAPTLVQASKSADFVIIGRSARETFATENWGANPVSTLPFSVPTVVELGNKRFFYPSDVGFRFSRRDLKQNHEIRNLIYISCDVPAVEDLIILGKLAPRVTYVKECGDHKINWSLAFSSGLPEYLRAHSNVDFIEFNISSLKLAKRLNGTLRDVENISAWQRWLKWQKVVADEEPSISRPLAVIDGVRRYRITH
jgi:hypothetical protein